MECNKDEAFRAKEIAEKKMHSNDFEGAQKMALRAKNLYPELENIIQMLSICDVHCSAQRRLAGSDKDWYGVLQVEKLADEATIKKQYRRLALILHPDKNRFPGAEGAFKLICEANALLSDPVKKSVYDNKIRVLSRSASTNPPNHNINGSSQLNKPYSAQGIHTSNGLSRENQHQIPQSASSVFWTCCPFCNNSYQYHRQYINRSLQCPKCKRVFVTYEVSARGVSSGSKLGSRGAPYVPSKPDVCQPAVFQEKVATNQENSDTGMQNAKVPSTSRAGSQGTAYKKTAQPRVKKGCGSESVKVASALHGEKVGVTSNGDATHREPRHVESKSQKRGKKLLSQLGVSSDSDTEDLSEQENLSDAARKSSRRKQHVSYKETGEDDYARPLKRAHTTKEANGDKQKAAVFGEDSMHGSRSSFPTAPAPSKFGNKEMGAAHSKESLKNKNGGCYKEGGMGGVPGGKSRAAAAADAVEIGGDSDLDLSSSKNSDTRCFDCPDPDFSDFDKLRAESHFHVDQFWACYDDKYDGMPRYYAKVTKVSASPFELRIKWLEAVPTSDAYKRWVDEELPVGCGSFKLVGRNEKVSGSLSLSHEVHCEMGKKKGSHFIYPRKGEVWALFRDWDISWSSKDHKDFKYEVVEVLSDFAAGIGIEVCYLNKVAGFVSLFQRASKSDSFVIEPMELYKFSHCVPSFKMTGTEREGVPLGSLELDSAALPLNPDHLYFPSKAKIEQNTPQKIVDLEGSRAEASILRRSPRGVNAVRQDTN